MDNIRASFDSLFYRIHVCQSGLYQLHFVKHLISKVLLHYINLLLVIQIPYGASDSEAAILEIYKSNSGTNITSDASNENQGSFVFLLHHSITRNAK